MTRHQVATSIVVYGEVVEYIKGAASFPMRLLALRTLVEEIRPLDLDYPTMETYADLRRRLRPPHGPGLIGDMDTLIAATALQHDLVLVTMDRDFRRVPDLTLLLLDRRR